jgi:flagella basal body P-ring formation protein FlgA
MMAGKSNRKVLVLALWTILFSANAVSAQNPSRELSINLKARSLVIGPRILLKEVCVIQTDDKAIQQKIGEVQLGKAPPPGESKELTLAFIKLQLRQAGLQKYIDKLSGPKSIRVTTAHEEISKAVLEDAVTDYVAGHVQEGDVKIELSRVPEKLRVPQTAYRLEIEPVGGFSGHGYQPFRVAIFQGDGEEVGAWPVSAVVQRFLEVAVAKERLSRRQTLSETTVAFEYRDVSRTSGAPIFRSDLAGKSLRTRVVVERGKTIGSSMIEEVPLVERGSIVKIIVAAGNVEIAMEGRAQESGQLAEAVKVRPLRNHKILQGAVVGPDVVRVVL